MVQQNFRNEATFPLPQPAPVRAAGQFVSYLFHPLFIPLYVSAYLIYLHPYSFAVFDAKQKFIRLLFVFMITCFFPALTVFLLWRLQFNTSIFLRTQKERIIPYVASIIYFFWAFYVTRNLQGTPEIMVFFFLGTFLAVSAALMANSYFKISMHAVAVGGGLAYMIILALISTQPMSIPVAVAMLIAGLVCTSRLLVSDHRPFEIYIALILSALCQLTAFYFIM